MLPSRAAAARSSASAKKRPKNIVDMQWTHGDIFTFLLDDGDISSDTSSESSDESCPEDVYFRPMKKFRSSPPAVDAAPADTGARAVTVTSCFRASAQRLSDEEFFEEFRVDRKTVDALAEKFRGSPLYACHTVGSQKALSAYDQFLIFLWFAGHRATFKTTSEQFGITDTSVYNVVRSVMGFLESLAGAVIRWPDLDEMHASAEYFRLKGVPFAIGAIAVEPIRIDRLGAEGYFNKEREIHSVPVQIVCDPMKYIRHVFVQRGSSDAASIFENSSVKEEIRLRCAHYVVLGDHHHPCLRNLVTPYRGKVLENKKKLFNHLLSSCRATVVQACLKKLKLKFPQLTHCKLRHHQDVTQFVTACCVLHNISLNDPFLRNAGDTFQTALPSSSGAKPEPESSGVKVSDSSEGLAYRNDLLTALSIRRNWR